MNFDRLTLDHPTLDWGLLARQVWVSALAMLAGWITMMSWGALTVDYVVVSFPLLLIGTTIVLVGSLARWLRWPVSVTVPLQSVITAALVLNAVTGSFAPTGGNLAAFRSVIVLALESAQRFVAPVPAGEAPVHPLLIIGGAVILLLIDLFAGTLGRVPVAGLALLTAYTVPVAVTTDSVSPVIFLVAGGFFLAALFAQHSDQLAQWSRGTANDSGDLSIRTGTVAYSGLALGASALALGVVLPLAVPTLETAVFDGPGPGTGAISVKDPMVDLRRDLQRGQDIPLLTVSTNGPRPSYLRMSVLTTFIDDTWTPGDREIPIEQTATGTMPGLGGVDIALPRSTSRYQVRVGRDFAATWLPTLPQISQVRAGIEWRYDLTTRDFIAARDGVTTAGRNYEFTGVHLDYDPRSMDKATSGITNVSSVFTDLPVGLDNEIRELAASVTADAPTRYQKMQRLQQWFRQDGGFRYDLTAVDSVGDDGADLAAFLDESGRVGYCEQFAAAMAIMARTLGVPSRVAVGFLEPESVGRGQWEFSAWDLHAWPELYFPGSGWVRFEPTPSARAEQVPTYTTADVTTATETASPTAAPSSEEAPEANPRPEETSVEADGSGASSALLTGLLIALAIGLLALTLCIPRWRRQALRSRRFGRGIEGVWDELRALTADLGHTWPTGRSPRRTGAQLERLMAQPTSRRERPARPRQGRGEAPDAARALERIVERLERSRYARSSTVTPNADTDGALQRDADLVAAALTSGVSARVERRAQWWPRSVTGWSWRRNKAGSDRGSTETNDLVTVTSEELVG